MTNNIIMIISTIVYLLSVLTASSWPWTCEPCGTKEVRKAALDKVLASIGCDDYACRKFRDTLYACVIKILMLQLQSICNYYGIFNR